MAFSDGWKRAQQQTREPALHNPLDPSHERPQTQEQIWWADTSGAAPGMPSAVEGEQREIGTPPAHGYIDMTPQGGDQGMPAFPGVTLAEGQEIRGIVHNQDFGAVAARKYVSPPNRDGDLNVGMVEAPDYEGNPAEQNSIRYVTGVGAQYDGGNSRHNVRQKRWRDRLIDFHWWQVEMNPSYVRQATPAVTKPMVTNGRTQAMSPFSAGEIEYTGDSFLAPMQRRTPEPWDNDLVQSGTPDGSDFGLGSWGL